MANSHKHRVPAAFGGIMDVNTGRKKYFLGSVLDFFTETLPDTYNTYKGVVDTATSVGKAYLDYKDAKRRNELEEAVYDDYMAAAEAAGQEAQAAIDLNLTPMTVANLPTKKADVTSFTKATGVKDGGIMRLKDGTTDPNPGITALRKVRPDVVAKMGLAGGGGPGIEALRKKAPEVVKRMGFNEGMNEEMQKENMEMAFYSTGRGDRADAMQIWSQMGTPDKSIFDFEFELFFQDGGWRDMIKGDLEETETDVMTASYEPGKYSDEDMEAYENYKYEMNEQRPGMPIMEIDEFLKFDKSSVSAPDPKSELNDLALMLYGKTLDLLTEEQLEDLQEMMMNNKQMPKQDTGIMQAAKGGRVKRAGGGIMDMGGMEKDYRFSGGFVPIGEYERKDDVPARLSKNEFVFTADAVRAAGGGSIQKGAKRMYDTMKNLEAKPQAKGMMT
ncbi:MAG: hypothetical protein CBD63_04450 [Candidatus Pelagibacter sp. TMED203]|nr:MAG: hypothetical protein CBD63_04450 [Candidatus Pelagibacter sp. TMED203]|tara:strand:- start:259 stop:1590 length:1332 start_codon:yes stop_codon:yes gene_type:complete